MISCLQINTKVFHELIVSLRVCVPRLAQSTQNNKFTKSLQYLKENMKGEVNFLPELQINIRGFLKLILSF